MSMTTCFTSRSELAAGGCRANMRRTFGGIKPTAALATANRPALLKSCRRVRLPEPTAQLNRASIFIVMF
jgi:hypothetical protein